MGKILHEGVLEYTREGK